MKRRRIFLTSAICIVIVALVVIRLVSNKRSMDDQLKLVSEFNTVVPVNTDTVKQAQLPVEFREPGNFTAFREISLIAETTGKVLVLSAVNGDHVRAGQELVSVENNVLKAQCELAKFSLTKAENDMKRFDELSKGDAATIQQYEAARQSYMNANSALISARKQLDDTSVKAPFPGILVKQYVERGSFLQPGSPVFDLVEIDKVKLILKLTTDELSKIYKGQAVTVLADPFPSVSYDGKISAIIAKADQSKKYDVEIEVNNHRDNEIKPGMTGTAFLRGCNSAQALVIPRKALTGSIQKPEVFVVKGDVVSLREITAEVFDDKLLRITSGLNAGDVVVVSGQINLVDGSKITLNK